MNDDPLKYRFVAEYKDGTVFAQNSDDVSAQDSKRSAFFDVRQDDLKTFSLWHGRSGFLVDLEDGHFEAGGAVFRFHAPGEVVPPFKLIFFRRHRQSVTVDYKLDEDKRPVEAGSHDRTHEVTFRLGWSAQTPGGEPIERVMEVE